MEFNTRLGDPETQPVLMRLQGDDDFFNLCKSYIHNSLIHCTVKWTQQPCLCVVMASKGYPETSTINSEIKNCTAVINQNKDTALFFAGAKMEGNKILSSGGRVLSVCALGKDIQSAQKLAYQTIEQIECEDLFYRKDIGYQAINKTQH